MTIFLFLMLGCGQAADAGPAPTLRYLRPAGNLYTLESVITTTSGEDRRTYDSLTVRGSTKMKLTIRFEKGRTVAAEAVLQTGQETKTAILKIVDGVGRLERGDKVEMLDDVRADAIVTTAPDWSDILQLVQRYDAAKAGKQEFAGLWIHPVDKTLRLTFTVEKIGQDKLQVKDKPLALDRYRIRLRSGDYIVWGDASRRVIKLVPAGSPKAVVVLEGFENAADGLRP